MNKVYEMVTDRILKQMENGTCPWHQGWFNTNACISYSTGKKYSILNQMLLGEAGEYITFKQIKEHGGKLKKGSKSKFVVFWKLIEEKVLDENGQPVVDDEGNEVKKYRPYLRYYNVFNINDCEGIDPKHIKVNNDFDPIEEAEKVIEDYLKRESIDEVRADYAAYSPKEDVIKMPAKEQFEKEAEYYSTYFHEMIHSTGAEKRLNRLEKTAFFGTESYSKEELVAEIGSAFMMNNLNIEGGFDNSVAYIKGWAERIADDPKLIVSAASRAEKAVDFIEGAK